MRIILALAAALAAVAPAARSAPEPPVNPEEAAVRATLEHYLAGHATGQASHFRAAFHPEARLLWVRDGTLAQRSDDEYIAAAGTGSPADDEAHRRRRIVSIDIAGDAAIAKIELDYPEVRFVDYMSLLKVDGEWRIVTKIFHGDRRTAAE